MPLADFSIDAIDLLIALAILACLVVIFGVGRGRWF